MNQACTHIRCLTLAEKERGERKGVGVGVRERGKEDFGKGKVYFIVSHM